MPSITSIQTGKPTTYGTPHAADPNDRTWRTAIFKQPVITPVWLGAESLDGDSVADRRYHGGPDNAVLCYSAEHYPEWQKEWQSAEALPYGGFGENLTITGLDESSVCLGDVYQVGPAEFQVSGPRKPCYKLERRWRRPGLIKRVQETNRGGWYARVLREGFLEAGSPITLIRRPRPHWTIARVCEVSYERRSREEVLELCSIPELAARWREWILGKLTPIVSSATASVEI